jgi:IclR family pca regulon transcriptional regulator
MADIRSVCLSAESKVNQLSLKKSVVDEIYRSGDSDYMVSLARGLHVIQVFCDDGRARLTIADITRLSGLSRTVVSRCLYTLQELGFVGREGRYFSLLPKVLKLGYGYVSTASLPSLAHPILNRLAERTQSAAAVVVLDGKDVLYVAKATPPSFSNVLSLNFTIGHRRRAFITGTGTVLLSHLSRPDLDSYFASLDQGEVESLAGRTVDDVRAAVERARVDGYALTPLVFSNSMRSLAVPIYNVVGNVVASMALAVYDEVSSDSEFTARHLSPLRAAVRSLSEQLVE